MSELVFVEIEQTRRFAVDIARIRETFGAEIAEDVARGRTERDSLRETFWELCGYDRDCDHIDGKYIWVTDENVTAEWPQELS